MENLQDQLETFLSTFEGDRISSRKLKNLMGLCTIAPRTWAKFIERCTPPKKEYMGECTFRWKLIGSAVCRVSAESFGFKAA
jgi:hypothetical protein